MIVLLPPLQEPLPLPMAEVRGIEGEDAWTFLVEPFLWSAGLSGDGSAEDSPPADLSSNLGEIFGALDGGFLLALEARPPESRWSVLADGLYVRFEDDEGTLRTETEIAMVELGAGFTPAAGAELLAGLRWIDLDFDVELAGAPASAAEDWIDPWVGARGRVPLGQSWSIGMRGDVGGFGVGSRLTWQALASAGRTLGGSWRLDLGYRALAVDYDEDELELDVIAHGPAIGLAWRP